jgi:hypothetical protein
MVGAHRDRRAEVVDEQMREGHQSIQNQEHFGEGAQAVLLAKLHQQQVHRHISHHVGGGQPGHFRGGGTQGALQEDQVGGHQRIAEAASQRHQQAHRGERQALGRAVQRRRGRARQVGLFVGLPVVGGVAVHADS